MLTEREFEILRRRAKGEKQRQIAAALDISQAAVCSIEKNAQRKMLEAERHFTQLTTLGITITDGAAGRKITYSRKRGAP